MAGKEKSKCVFCGSTTFGRSCPFGPKKTHFHSTPDACGWCGSKTLHGPGCPFNPFSKYHQTGMAFVPMALEAAESGITRGLIMKKLSEPITEMNAFKLGIIDESGKQIRNPENIVERNCFTATDKYLLRLRKLSENSIALINTKLYFECSEECSMDELKKLYPIELECIDEVSKLIKDICKLTEKYAKLGLQTSKVEKIIAESFLDVKKQSGAITGSV